MIKHITNIFITCSIFSSLVLIDYVLGNGFRELLKNLFVNSVTCDTYCFLGKIFNFDNLIYSIFGENAVNVQPFIVEMIILSFTMTILNIIKNIRCKDKFYDLVQECKEILSQIPKTLDDAKTIKELKESYLEENLQAQASTVEVPLLHMAIVEMNEPRKPERCDAGDTIDIGDSTMISITSLLVNSSDYSLQTNESEEIAFTNEEEYNSNIDNFMNIDGFHNDLSYNKIY